MRSRFLLALLIGTTVVAGCGGSSETYSSEDAVTAFARQGIRLSENTLPERAGEFLTKGTDSTFYVVVDTGSFVDDLWANNDGDWQARRGNVLSIGLGEPKARDRTRVLEALEALPDSDQPVEVSGG